MSLIKLFETINLKPNNIDLYYQALTHTSFINEKRTGKSYQTLEFVGDALIDLETASYLYKNFPDLTEGEMTVIRANVVNGNALAKHSRDLKLQELVKLGKGANEVRKNTKVQADLFESLCAAIYIDLGIEKVREFLSFNVFKDIKSTEGKSMKNPKTLLQEMLQADSRENVTYESETSDNNFIATVFHDGIKLGSGQGNTKKEAEIKAAISALSKFERGEHEIN